MEQGTGIQSGEKKKKYDDVYALIFGILSIVMFFVVVLAGVISGIVGIICGTRARSTSVMGKAGYILSVIGLIMNAGLWIYSILRFSAA